MQDTDPNPTHNATPSMTLKQVVESILFATQKPLSVKEIVAALKSAADYSEEESVAALHRTKAPEVESLLGELRAEYEGGGRGFRLVEGVGGWQVVSAPECAVWVRQLFPEARSARLSGPALETLAIIAYRQPITRADIEAVRGVAVDGVLNTLLDRGLVKIAGRADVPGRPLLYETSQHFLEHFGLRHLDELPNAGELRQVKLPTAEPPAEPPAQQLELQSAPEEAAADEQAGPDADTPVPTPATAASAGADEDRPEAPAPETRP